MERPVRKPLDHNPHPVARFGADFFITICCQKRGVNQLCQKHAANVLLETARLYHDTGRWYLHLCLLMPDHLHALIGLDGDANPADVVRDFKRITARKGNIQWQRNFFDHRIRNDKSFADKADYILENPVRAGLVDKTESWEYVIKLNEAK
jgi:putative transposase